MVDAAANDDVLAELFWKSVQIQRWAISSTLPRSALLTPIKSLSRDNLGAV